MLRVFLRRLAVAIPTLLVVTIISFLLVQIVPGSPADFILGNTATADQVAQLNSQLGLDQPLIVQYFTWLGGILTGDMGTSYTTNQPVVDALTTSLPPTLSIALLSTAVSLVLGLMLGMAAAVRGGRVDSAIQTVSNLGLAVPSFWLGAVLVLIFAIELAIFPATGYTNLLDSPVDWALGLVLPVAAVALAALAQIMLQARSSVLDTLSRDFVRVLQAAGVPRRSILYRHVLRNAAIPVATVTGLTFIFTLSGVVVIETVFNIAGMGTLTVASVKSHDLPTLQGAVVYFGVVVIVVNLVVDLIVAKLDPRARVS